MRGPLRLRPLPPEEERVISKLARSQSVSKRLVERAKDGDGLRLTATADAAALAKWLGQLHGKKQP